MGHHDPAPEPERRERSTVELAVAEYVDHSLVTTMCELDIDEVPGVVRVSTTSRLRRASGELVETVSEAVERGLRPHRCKLSSECGRQVGAVPGHPGNDGRERRNERHAGLFPPRPSRAPSQTFEHLSG